MTMTPRITSFKPMLAYRETPNLHDIEYPVLASPKYDGIRCIITSRGGLTPASTRSLKAVPNLWVQLLMSNLTTFVPDAVGLDGELMLRKGGTFSEVQSAIMSIDGEPDFTFNVFDFTQTPNTSFRTRLDYAGRAVKEARRLGFNWVRLVEHKFIRRAEDLELYEQNCLREGFEGAMVRDPNGPYKFGRSTLREGYLIKIKRHSTAEAVVVGYEELMHNENPATVNELGKTERSSSRAGMRRTGKLGALLVVADVTDPTRRGIEFAVGTGFNDAERVHFWNTREQLLGKTITYKYQPDAGYVRPRQPVFIGIRNSKDLS